MFGLFGGNPVKALEKKYARLMEEARNLQRNGDIEGFAAKSAEAETLLAEINAKKAEA